MASVTMCLGSRVLTPDQALRGWLSCVCGVVVLTAVHGMIASGPQAPQRVVSVTATHVHVHAPHVSLIHLVPPLPIRACSLPFTSCTKLNSGIIASRHCIAGLLCNKHCPRAPPPLASAFGSLGSSWLAELSPVPQPSMVPNQAPFPHPFTPGPTTHYLTRAFSTRVQICPAGKYSLAGAASCTNCTAGYVCSAGGSSPLGTSACAAGLYVGEGGRGGGFPASWCYLCVSAHLYHTSLALAVFVARVT
jgi:hypothetical protein